MSAAGLNGGTADRAEKGLVDKGPEVPTCPDGTSNFTGRPLHVVTPLLKSRKLSDKVGANVWLKLESVQNSGSFKMRGIGLFCQKVCECVL